MKKIGKEVLFLKTGEGNLRNGEGSMICTKDGRIRFVFTEYVGEGRADHATARLSVCDSTDGGEHWTAPRVLIPKPADAQNIMSPSLFRMKDGSMGMVYLRKDVLENGGVICMPLFVRSEDEGDTWSTPCPCGFPEGYYCVISDGVLVTEGGRIYVPASYTGEVRDVMHVMKPAPRSRVSDVRIAYSDNNGQSWQVLEHVFSSPYDNSRGLFEPGLFEHEDGTLWMYARTVFGHQYQSLSHDGGKTWSAVMPNFRFTTPDSPMRVKRLGRYVAAIYNPIGYNCLFLATESAGSPKRTPIVMTVSHKDGKDLGDPAMTPYHGGFLEIARNTYFLEEDLSNSYCYPSVLAMEDGILVSYYHSDGDVECLNACKVIKILYEEIT